MNTYKVKIENGRQTLYINDRLCYSITVDAKVELIEKFEGKVRACEILGFVKV